MLPALLIFVLSLFVFYCIRFMVRHGEDIPAYFFLGFYLYTVFAQIGYVYYPELSKRLALFLLDVYISFVRIGFRLLPADQFQSCQTPPYILGVAFCIPKIGPVLSPVNGDVCILCDLLLPQPEYVRMGKRNPDG